VSLSRLLYLQKREKVVSSAEGSFTCFGMSLRESPMAGGACMTPVPKKRRTSAALRLFVPILGAAIFAWGLHGKLALYKALSPSRQVSIAKLIHDDANDRRVYYPLEPLHRGSFFPTAISGALEPFSPQRIVRRNRQVRRLVLSSIPFYPNALLFRPPPSIV
jgi:hypothetical protein